MLVGNKNDKLLERQVDSSAARGFAEKLDMIFVEASAKENANVDKIFMMMALQLKEKLGTPVNDNEDTLKIGTTREVNQENSSKCCSWI